MDLSLGVCTEFGGGRPTDPGLYCHFVAEGRLVVVESTPQQDYARIAWLWTPCFRGITYVHRAVLGVAAPLPI